MLGGGLSGFCSGDRGHSRIGGFTCRSCLRLLCLGRFGGRSRLFGGWLFRRRNGGLSDLRDRRLVFPEEGHFDPVQNIALSIKPVHSQGMDALRDIRRAREGPAAILTH